MADPAQIEFGQLLLGGIGLVLLAGGGLLLFLVTYQKRLLQLRAAQAGHQEQALLAIIEAQEGERARIGQDLHDGIGATLATARLLVSQLGKLPATADPAELHALINNLMGAAVQDVRSVAHHLYPAVLARYGLADAIRHLVEVSREAGTLPIELHLHYPQARPLAQELALYRICQELIHNALRHAKGATQLLVRLEQQGPQLTLAVQDDGCGLPPAGPPAGRGVGLRSIEVRVRMLGARLQQQSWPGQGLRIAVELAAGQPAAPLRPQPGRQPTAASAAKLVK